MRAGEVADAYLAVARGLDRYLPGFADVDGPPVPVPALTPPELVRAAGRLALAVPDLVEPVRADFLLGQLHACEWAARRLAGQAVPYVEEVRAAFGVRIEPGDPDVYRAAHRELDALLPGPSDLAVRLARHRERDEIPRHLVGPAVRAVSDALRERTREVVALPAREHVEYRVVDDAPWSALHHYRGDFRSTVTVNAGARLRYGQLASLVAHEVYPGHHTERCRKEAGLVARGWDEHRAVCANTPQGLVAEGAADLGLHAVVGPGWGRWAAAVLDDLVPGLDGDLAERVDDASSVLSRVRQDAALLLHDRGAAPEDVLDHLQRWLLVGRPRAEAVLRFVTHPLWRAYTSTYVEGRPLVRRWWEQGDPGERLRRLLDDPVTPWVLRDEPAQLR